MAKINISFDGTDYAIDEANLEPAKAELKTHLSSVINGSGATINFDGTAYSVDSIKLSNATNNLISYFQTITGSGFEIVINGTTYSIDSSKLNDSINALHTAFDKLQSGGSRLLAPFINIDKNILNIYDETDLATSFDILVDGEVKASVEVVTEEATTDELEGTWVFNITISSRLNDQINVNFTSNGVDYEAISDERDADPVDYLWYGRWTAPQSVPTVYYYDMDTWANIAYKTIVITSKLSEVTNGEALLSWLKANATKQTSESESVVGTWYFNESISYLEGYHSCSFSSNANSYIALGTDYEGNIGGDLVPADVYLVYFRTETTYDEVYADGWDSSNYRTITITSEPTDTAFIEWLKANATKSDGGNDVSPDPV